MPLPNFVGIGVERGATTWTFNCLREHPDIFIPDIKEINFFNAQFDKGLDWYKDQFQLHAGQKAVGEITPAYLHSELAIPRMAQVIPHARLFVVLREPIQRAFSAYRLHHEKYRGLTFQEACSRSDHLIRMGLYSQPIERVFEYYDRSAIKILLYDDIQRNPKNAISEIFSFLQIGEDFVPYSLDKIYNHIVFPRTQELLNTIQLNWMIDIVKKTKLGEKIKWWSASKGFHNGVVEDEKFIQYLHNIFDNDIVKLQKIIKRDLSDWL